MENLKEKTNMENLKEKTNMEDDKKFEYASPELVELFMGMQIVQGQGDSRIENQADSESGDAFDAFDEP